MIFTPREMVIFAVAAIGAVVAIFGIATGQISI
jgi:arginine:ornithine antiporter/lysine permease